jgi:hypothetical protein
MTIANIPPEADAFGTPIREHRESGRGCLLFGLAALAVYGLFLMGMGISMASGQSVGAGIAAALTGLLVVTLPSTWGFLKTRKHKPLRILAFEDGLAFTQAGQTTTAHWQDIVAIWQNIPKINDKAIFPAERPCTRLQLRSGQLFQIKGISKGEELQTQIRRETFKIMLPEAIQALQAGQDVTFGEVICTPAGINYRNFSLPWENFCGSTVEQNKFIMLQKYGKTTISEMIKTEGRGKNWLALPSDKVPNLLVLMGLIETMTSKGQGENISKN